jgi:CRISPR system Cascade subunit CasA
MTGYSFNLVTEPWIPCVDLAGKYQELGLWNVVQRAHELREISDPSPLATVALHRLLIAVLHRALDGPADHAAWRELWQARRLPSTETQIYLSKWSDRWDLFHEEYPFFQVGGFQTVDNNGDATEPVPVARLSVERAVGNNSVLFDHSEDAAPSPMTPAQAARALLATQAFALCGGQGPSSNLFGKHPYTSHATQVGGVAVLLRGSNLAETLLLNLLPYDASRPISRRDGDRPVWERTAAREPGETHVDGYLDYLTLRSRFIRLLPSGAPSEAMVTHAYVAPGLSLPSGDSAPVNPLWFYRLDPKKGPMPVALRVDRAIWRDSSTLFAMPSQPHSFDGRPQALRLARSRKVSRLLGADARLMVTCYGLANDKGKALAWRREELPAPVRLLDDPDLVEIVTAGVADTELAAGALRKALRSFAYRLLETEGKDPDPKDVGRLSHRMEAKAGFWSELDEPFLRFLRELDQDPEASLRAWSRHVLATARLAYQRGARFGQGPIDRQLRAEVHAERTLHINLAPLRERAFQAPNKEG